MVPPCLIRTELERNGPSLHTGLKFDWKSNVVDIVRRDTDTMSTGLHILWPLESGMISVLFLGSIIRTFGLKGRCKILQTTISLYCIFTLARIFLIIQTVRFSHMHWQPFCSGLLGYIQRETLGIIIRLKQISQPRTRWSDPPPVVTSLWTMHSIYSNKSVKIRWEIQLSDHWSIGKI